MPMKMRMAQRAIQDTVEGGKMDCGELDSLMSLRMRAGGDKTKSRNPSRASGCGGEGNGVAEGAGAGQGRG